MNRLKEAVNSKKSKGIRTLSKTFRSLSSFDKNYHLDRDEFLIGLKEHGVELNKIESDALINIFDCNRDGTIDINQFLIAIRVFFFI